MVDALIRINIRSNTLTHCAHSHGHKCLISWLPCLICPSCSFQAPDHSFKPLTTARSLYIVSGRLCLHTNWVIVCRNSHTEDFSSHCPKGHSWLGYHLKGLFSLNTNKLSLPTYERCPSSFLLCQWVIRNPPWGYRYRLMERKWYNRGRWHESQSYLFMSFTCTLCVSSCAI